MVPARALPPTTRAEFLSVDNEGEGNERGQVRDLPWDVARVRGNNELSAILSEDALETVGRVAGLAQQVADVVLHRDRLKRGWVGVAILIPLGVSRLGIVTWSRTSL